MRRDRARSMRERRRVQKSIYDDRKEVHPALYLKLNVRVLVFFFFQAEDGIRDVAVTGVQTCALPISFGLRNQLKPFSSLLIYADQDAASAAAAPPDLEGSYIDLEMFYQYVWQEYRSEERRVGKECRSRWSPYH